MFLMTLVTPEKKLVVEQEIEEVTVPAYRGELNILPGHAPLITNLTTGVLRYKLKGQPEQILSISWGYCQVNPLGVYVLADYAEAPADLRIEDLKKALAENEKKLGEQTLTDAEWAQAQREVDKARTGMEIFPNVFT